MMHPRILVTGLFLLFTSTAVAWAGSAYPIPEGFAVYKDSSLAKAVSPDGVVYRVRIERNKPYAKLSFWKEALKKRMLDAGYVFKSDSDITAGARTGYLLELMAPFGNEDYTYLIAIFAKRYKKIVIVEAAGEAIRFVKHRNNIFSAISGIKF